MRVDDIGASQFKGVVELGIMSHVFSLSRVNISFFATLLSSCSIFMKNLCKTLRSLVKLGGTSTQHTILCNCSSKSFVNNPGLYVLWFLNLIYHVKISWTTKCSH
ncbi:hypothetical protein ACOSP7_002692 [Xanthoceras sorbifolium]